VKRSKDRVHEHKRRFEGHSLTSSGWMPSRGEFSGIHYNVSRGPAKETLCCSTKMVVQSGLIDEARFWGDVREETGRITHMSSRYA
jgi:hypothetical protein